MKKIMWSVIIGAVILIIGAFLLGRFVFPNDGLAYLPAPELAEGERGQLGIDKNVNEATIDKYLGRKDAVYRDVRMLVDPGNYSAIGGDSYLSGFVNGFEVVPFPYLVNVTGLPDAVGNTYSGKTLFSFDGNNYKANYVESMEALEALFPKDKIIFLMCGGGGYSGMLKNMLVALGWDASKIYDVGGYWFYDGANDVKVKRELEDGRIVYDFYKVPYHEIDFDSLTEWKPGELVDVSAIQYERMIAEGRSFLVFVDQGGCHTADRLREFIQKYSKETGRVFYRIMFSDMKETSLYESVKFYPSVAIISDGEATKWLRADEDEDADIYNNYDDFVKWMKQV